MGVTCEDVLFAIFDFLASPLYVDELGGSFVTQLTSTENSDRPLTPSTVQHRKEMHPRAVRIMEQQ
jgi:hypothetical protein